jgi:hypothetical protein
MVLPLGGGRTQFFDMLVEMESHQTNSNSLPSPVGAGRTQPPMILLLSVHLAMLHSPALHFSVMHD